MATSNWGWHGMASFAERGLTPHPAKTKVKVFESKFSNVEIFRNCFKHLGFAKKKASKPFKNLKLPFKDGNEIRTFRMWKNNENIINHENQFFFQICC